MAAQELRPMGIGDILDVTFRLYRQRFFAFLLIALIVYVPYALFMAVGQPSFMTTGQPYTSAEENPVDAGGQPMTDVSTSPAPFPLARLGFVILGFLLFALVLIPLCSAALVHNISASYLGEKLTAGQSYARAAPRLLGLIGTQILGVLVIVLGIVMLIVPGIIFSLWFIVLVPVVILEGRAGSKALGRSRELMRGNIDKGFKLMLVVGLLGWIIGLALGMVVGLVPWPHEMIRVFMLNALQAIILPIQTAPPILLYYDLRIRKEAFDLQKLSEALGQPAASEPAVT